MKRVVPNIAGFKRERDRVHAWCLVAKSYGLPRDLRVWIARKYVWDKGVKANVLVDANVVDVVLASLDKPMTIPGEDWTFFVLVSWILLTLVILVWTHIVFWVFKCTNPILLFWVFVFPMIVLFGGGGLEFISKKYRRFRGIYQFQERERVVEWN